MVSAVCLLVIWASEGVLETWQLAGIFLNEWGKFPVHLWRIWSDIKAWGCPSAACNWYRQENHYYSVETCHKSGTRQTGVPIWGWQSCGLVYCFKAALPRESESPCVLWPHHTHYPPMKSVWNELWNSDFMKLLFHIPLLVVCVCPNGLMLLSSDSHLLLNLDGSVLVLISVYYIHLQIMTQKRELWDVKHSICP